jgi:hypothetical protein
MLGRGSGSDVFFINKGGSEEKRDLKKGFFIT